MPDSGQDQMTDAPFIDALTDDRQHIQMRGRRYTATLLAFTCSVVCQSYKKIISEGQLIR